MPKLIPLNNIAEQINQLLPQTQCTRCGYPACRDYAQAISTGNAEINQCPPGGELGIVKLASLLQRTPLALNHKHGEIKPLQLAVIDEDACIGCTLCIKACPVDAILGSNKTMHSVIASECTGCELCIPACPVDCISMLNDDEQWNTQRRDKAEQRYLAREQRKQTEQEQRELRLTKA